MVESDILVLAKHAVSIDSKNITFSRPLYYVICIQTFLRQTGSYFVVYIPPVQTYPYFKEQLNAPILPTAVVTPSHMTTIVFVNCVVGRVPTYTELIQQPL